MANTIGMRGYLMSLQKRGKRVPLPLNTENLKLSPMLFTDRFISSCAAPTQDAALERSWYFDQQISEGVGNSKGYIQYGTFGFESNFIDKTTKKRHYRRKVSDIKEIPLFYQFWFPENSQNAFIMFQSFQGRSCIQLVMSKMQENFEQENPGFVLRFKKLLPNDLKGSMYYSAPVKRLRLIKRDLSGDLADRYLGARVQDTIDFELSLSAKRKNSLGVLLNLGESLKRNAAGIVMHDGIVFDEAVAEIRVGGRLRRVGVFGTNNDAGVIDVTDVVERGPDGHPTFASLAKEANELLVDFHKTLGESRS